MALIVGLNLNRRHLNASQRAMIGARIKPAFEEEAKKRQATSSGGSSPQLVANLPQAETGKSRELAAATVNVSPRLVESASNVQKNGTPELVGMVEAGEVTVSAAAEVALLPESEQAAVVADGPDAVKGKAAEIRPLVDEDGPARHLDE